MKLTRTLNRKSLKNYGQWIQPTLSGTFWCHWREAADLNKLFAGKRFQGFIFLNGHHIIQNSDVANFRTIVKKISGQQSGINYARTMEKLGQDYQAQHLNVLKLVKTSDNYLPKLFKTYKNLVGLWWFCIPLGQEIEQYIRKNWPEIDNDTLFELTKPIRPTWLETQSMELRQLAKQAKSLGIKKLTKQNLNNYGPLAKKITAHLEKLSWFGTHHWMGQGFNLSKCIEEINQALNSELKQKNKSTVRSPVPAHIVKLARTVNYWRTHCAELTCKVVFLSRPVLNKLAKKWNLSYEDLTYLSHTEILKFLNQTKLPSNYKKIIAARKIEYGCILDGKGQENIFIGQDYKKILNRLVESKISTTNELHGIAASIGPDVQAKACIIMSPKDFKTFKKGNILITNETTPDFVPLMKIASAIVTDVGGITSHAAILSRELNKPCLVGTQHATKTFKNGDIIEVNTNKGTVRKI